jgi:hypothetical protein
MAYSVVVVKPIRLQTSTSVCVSSRLTSRCGRLVDLELLLLRFHWPLQREGG